MFVAEFWKSKAFLMALRSKDIFLDSSMVEHSAVNRVVVGSSPTRGVSKFGIFFSFLHIIILIRRLSQVVRHGTATP